MNQTDIVVARAMIRCLDVAGDRDGVDLWRSRLEHLQSNLEDSPVDLSHLDQAPTFMIGCS